MQKAETISISDDSSSSVSDNDSESPKLAFKMCSRSCSDLCGRPQCLNCFNRSIASRLDSLLTSRKIRYAIEKNNNKDPMLINIYSNEKLIWECLNNNSVCSHMWEATPLAIFKKKRGCQHVCCGRYKICGDGECSVCFKYSVEGHRESLLKDRNILILGLAECDPKQIKTLSQVAIYSSDLITFQCEVSAHIFVTPADKMFLRGDGCPFICCSTSAKRLCGVEFCKFCFNASLESKIPSLKERGIGFVRAVDSNLNTLNLTPIQISIYSHIKIEWKCLISNIDTHTWFTSPDHINRLVDPTECPRTCCCSNVSSPCDDDQCDCCLKWSLASKLERLKLERGITLLSLDGVVENNPRIVAAHSSIVGEWKCELNHVWFAAVYHVVENRGCPDCPYKTQALILKEIEIILNGNGVVVSEKIFPWSKKEGSDCFLRYDFYIVTEDEERLIELDGMQHFRDIAYFSNKSFEERQEIDTFKTKLALDHGIPILRLCQEDVWESHLGGRKWDWKTVLREFLTSPQPVRQYYGSFRPNESFMDVYVNHKKLLAVCGEKRPMEEDEQI